MEILIVNMVDTPEQAKERKAKSRIEERRRLKRLKHLRLIQQQQLEEFKRHGLMDSELQEQICRD